MTNNARPATLAALDLFGLRSSFDLVLTRDDVPMKPDPTGIVRAMETFATEAARTVMVGDSWLDGRAAHAAGVAYIGFRPRPGLLHERGVPYWAVVQQLGELLPLLAGPWPSAAAQAVS
jgi:phosphoglycolate phosphatase-like HAD superfamily hydrolase